MLRARVWRLLEDLSLMASITQNLINSVLSAEQVRQLTGWPDALVLDYITTIQNLISVSENLDQANENIGSIDESIQGIDESIQGIDGSISSIQEALTALSNLINANKQEADNVSAFIQLTLNQVRALLQRLERQMVTNATVNAAELHIEGAGTSDPTLTNPRNVSSISRNSAGNYRAVLQSPVGVVTPVVNSIIAPDATSPIFNVNVQLVSSVNLDIIVTQIDNTFSSNPYDIVAGDTLDIILLSN